MTKLYQRLASCVQAHHNCIASGNDEWRDRHADTARELVRRYMPSGAGIDTGTKLADKSTGEKLIFTCSFHHMNEHGFYDGWTEHTVTVTGSLQSGIDIAISGRDRNQIKDYLHDAFHTALTLDVPEAAWLAICGVGEDAQ